MSCRNVTLDLETGGFPFKSCTWNGGYETFAIWGKAMKRSARELSRKGNDAFHTYPNKHNHGAYEYAPRANDKQLGHAGATAAPP